MTAMEVALGTLLFALCVFTIGALANRSLRKLEDARKQKDVPRYAAAHQSFGSR
ncbi:MAG TPA: hypothetical protein VN822_00650 [Candidatus Acidoferrales bacterium]|nr:hypothetical protein [Candidatus Acidoferrales bacterium]